MGYSGMQRPYGTHGPMQGPIQQQNGVMTSIESSVHSVGRFSEILHMNLDALHMSFSSIYQLISNATMFSHEFGAAFSDVAGINLFWKLLKKFKTVLHKLFCRLTGRKYAPNMDNIFNETGNDMKDSPVWLNSLVLLAFGWWVVRRLLRHRPQQPIQQGPWNASGFSGPSSYGYPAPHTMQPSYSAPIYNQDDNGW